MTQGEFLEQIERLKTKFGSKIYDPETTRILGAEVSGIRGNSFKRYVDQWIGSRKPNFPPLLVDFREARIAAEKERFEETVRQVDKTLKGDLKEVLRKHYKVDTLSEAMELERFKLRMGYDKGRGK